jgi:hypothetical protein
MMIGVTRWVGKPGISPGEQQNRLRHHGTCLSFSGTCDSESHMFLKKKRYLPPCWRRIGPVVQADAWLGTDRVTPNNERII